MASRKETTNATKTFLRISLRTTFVLLTVVCIWGAFQVNRARKQQRAVARVKEFNGLAWYDYEYTNNEHVTDPNLPGPDWLRNLIGDDYFAQICFVRLRKQQINDLEYLKDFPGLTTLVCDTRAVSNEGNVLLKLKQLRTLSLYGPPLSDVGIDHIKQLSHLEKFIANGDAVTESGIVAIRTALPNCQVER